MKTIKKQAKILASLKSVKIIIGLVEKKKKNGKDKHYRECGKKSC